MDGIRQSTRAPRADARRNRERILTAARDVFAEGGVEVPMSDVARRAEVGIATLARNFTSRDELVAATFASTICGQVRLVEAALANPDAWAGFCGFVEAVCTTQASDLGCAQALMMAFPDIQELEEERSRVHKAFAALVDAAKATGRLRADFVPEDLPMVMMANAGVVSAAGTDAPETARRLVAYLIQSFSSENTAPLPAASTPRQMVAAVRRIGRRARGHGSVSPT